MNQKEKPNDALKNRLQPKSFIGKKENAKIGLCSKPKSSNPHSSISIEPRRPEVPLIRLRDKSAMPMKESQTSRHYRQEKLAEKRRQTARNAEEKPMSEFVRRKLSQDSSFMTFTESIEKGIVEKQLCIEKDSFLYLSLKDKDNPYSLRIVDHREVDARNYATLSKFGITRFIDDGTESQSEFLELEQFEREFFIYSLLTKISVFKKFRIWKGFGEWKRIVRRVKYNARRKTILKSLLILHPMLRDSILTMRKGCCELGNMNLFAMSRSVPSDIDSVTIHQFRDIQAKVNVKTRLDLEKFNIKAIEQMLETCELYLQSYLVSNGFLTEGQDLEMCALISETLGQSSSISQCDPPQRDITFTERAAVRTQSRKLIRFLRLADFMIIDAYLELGISSVTKLASTIVKANEVNHNASELKEMPVQPKPLFVVTAVLDDNNLDLIRFKPKDVEFRAVLESSIYEALSTISHRERILGLEQFQPYISAASIDGLQDESSTGDLESMLVENTFFQGMTDAINTTISSSFAYAATEIRLYNKYLASYVTNTRFTSNVQLKAKLGTNPAQLRLLLQQYKDENEEFNTLPEYIQISNILKIDTLAINQKIKPSPMQCFQLLLENIIPDMIQSQNESLLEQYQEANDNLSKSPKNLPDYSKLIATRQLIEDSLADMELQYSMLRKLYSLTEDFEYELTDSQKSRAMMLGQTRSHLKSTIAQVDSEAERNLLRFTKEFNEIVPVFQNRLDNVLQNLDMHLLQNSESSMTAVLDYLSSIRTNLHDLTQLSEKHDVYREILNLNIKDERQDFTLQQIKNNYDTYNDIWCGLQQLFSYVQIWSPQLVINVDTREIESKLSNFRKLIVLHDSDGKCERVVATLQNKVQDIDNILPLVEFIVCPDYQDRHWEKITEILRADKEEVLSMTVAGLISADMSNHTNRFETVYHEAKEEACLMRKINSLAVQWEKTKLNLLSIDSDNEYVVLGPRSNLTSALADSQTTLNYILCSPYVGYIKNMVLAWQKRLFDFGELLTRWYSFQSKWFDLAAVFSSPDIMRQLVSETKKFQILDSSWKYAMGRALALDSCLGSAEIPGLHDLLYVQFSELETLDLRLRTILNAKREVFPRLYFLSDPKLLQIISSQHDPTTINMYLRNLFSGIFQLEFQSDPTSTSKSFEISAMISRGGERISLGRNLKIWGPLEEWLSEVELSMKASMNKHIKTAMIDYNDENRMEWLQRHPAQSILVSCQILWAVQVEQMLKKYEKSDVQDSLQRLCDRHASQVLQLKNCVLQPELSNNVRRLVSSLICLELSQRDVLGSLIRGPSTVEQFAWTGNLRYYWEKECDAIDVQSIGANYKYGFEYFGDVNRIVVTPQTIRFRVAFMLASKLHRGLSITGNSGTGQKSMVLDLSNAIAIFATFFDCQNCHSYTVLSKILLGAAVSGSWACLSSIDRLESNVISLFSSQLLQLQELLCKSKATTSFLGKMINIQPFLVFSTGSTNFRINSQHSNYFNSAFIPFAMTKPNLSVLLTMRLQSSGFKSSNNVGRFIKNLFQCFELWLMQSTGCSSSLIFLSRILDEVAHCKRLEMNESAIAVKIAQQFPKFSDEAAIIFDSLVKANGGNYEACLPVASTFDKIVSMLLRESKIIEPNALRDRIYALKQKLDSYKGVALVGAAGTGKSRTHELLKLVKLKLSECNPTENVPVVSTTIYPNCYTINQLYGCYNGSKQIWRDGIVTSILRKLNNFTGDASANSYQWIILDGPIAGDWIEYINSIVSNEKNLVVESGESLLCSRHLRIIFEGENLSHASPSTVNQIGLIYYSQTELTFEKQMRFWFEKSKIISTLTAQEILTLEHLVKLFCEPILRCIKEQCDVLLEISTLHLATNLCRFFDVLIVSHCVRQRQADLEAKSSELSDKQKSEIAARFIFSLVWAVCAHVDPESRRYIDHTIKLVIANGELRIPIPSSFFEAYFACDSNCPILWEESIPHFEFSSVEGCSNIVIPNAHLQKSTETMKLFMQNKVSTLIIGSHQTGKSTILRELNCQIQHKSSLESCLAYSSEADGRKSILLTFMHCFKSTSLADMQSSLEGTIVHTQSHSDKGQNCLNRILFIDDLALPQTTDYGVAPAIECFRQLVNQQGFYSNTTLEWKSTEQYIFCASMDVESIKNKCKSERFLRQFQINFADNFSEKRCHYIFSKLLESFLLYKKFPDEVRSVASIIVESTVTMLLHLRLNLIAIPSKRHYLFSVKDISKIVEGIMQVHSGQCNNRTKFVNLWVHETMRDFGDRLVCGEDRKFVQEELLVLLHDNLGINRRYDDVFLPHNSIFFTWNKSEAGECNYTMTTNIKALGDHYQFFIDEYNSSSNSSFNVILFQKAVEQICRLVRGLTMKRSYSLLLGDWGTGKRTISRLACLISGQECIQLQYDTLKNRTKFRIFIKDILKQCGVQGRRIVVLISNYEITCTSILQELETLITCFNVFSFFGKSEVDILYLELSEVCKNQHNAATQDFRNLCKVHFNEQVKKNFGLILCLSHNNENYQTICSQHTSLFTEGRIYWHEPWKVDSLNEISNAVLRTDSFAQVNIADTLLPAFSQIHMSVLQNAANNLNEIKVDANVNVRSYLELLTLYPKLLKMGVARHEKELVQVSAANKKLDNIITEIAALKCEYSELKSKEYKGEDSCKRSLSHIQDQKKELRTSNAKTHELESKLNSINSRITALQSDNASNKNKVLLQLEHARSKVASISIVDTDSLLLQNPRHRIHALILTTTSKLLGVENWGSLDSTVSTTDIQAEMMQFDPVRMVDEHVELLNNCMSEIDLNEVETAKIGEPANILFLWLHALQIFAEATKDSHDILNQINSLSNEAQVYEVELKQKRKVSQSIVVNIGESETLHRASQKGTRQIKEGIKSLAEKIEKSEMAINLLVGHGPRWKREQASLLSSRTLLKGDILICAAAISYATAFTSLVRRRIVSSWQKLLQQEYRLPCTISLDIVNICCDKYDTIQWHDDGLPVDVLARENAAALLHSHRWPLFVDPQSVARNWITNSCNPDMDPIQCSSKSDTLLQMVVRCIKNGSTLFLDATDTTNLPELFIFLDSLKNCPDRTIFFPTTDENVQVHPDFRLYLFSDLIVPVLHPKIGLAVNVINFAYSRDSLEDLLLDIVVAHEDPQTYETRKHSLNSICLLDQKTRQLEDKVLSEFVSLDGLLEKESVFKNDKTLGALCEANSLLEEDLLKLSTHRSKLDSLNTRRQEFATIAIRATTAYFVGCELDKLDPQYFSSFKSFLKTFRRGLAESTTTTNTDERIKHVIEYQTQLFLQLFSGGLHCEYKDIYASTLAAQILLQSKIVSSEEWEALQILVKVGYADWKKTNNGQSISLNFDNRSLSMLMQVPGLERFPQAVKEKQQEWSNWCQGNTVFDTVPHEWQHLPPVQRVMIRMAIDYPQGKRSYEQFISHYFGQHFVRSATMVNLNDLTKHLDCRTPCIVRVSPSTDVETFVCNMRRYTRDKGGYHTLPLLVTSDQNPVELLKLYMAEGEWVLVNDEHVLQSWFCEVERFLNSLPNSQNLQSRSEPDFSEANINENFRLIVATYGEAEGIGWLKRSSVKVVLEERLSIQSHLLELYNAFVTETSQGVEQMSNTIATWIYKLCLVYVLLCDHESKYTLQRKSDVLPLSSLKYLVCQIRQHCTAVELMDNTTIFNMVSCNLQYNSLCEVDTAYCDGLLQNILMSVGASNHYKVELQPLFEFSEKSSLDWLTQIKYLVDKSNDSLLQGNRNSKLGESCHQYFNNMFCIYRQMFGLNDALSVHPADDRSSNEENYMLLDSFSKLLRNIPMCMTSFSNQHSIDGPTSKIDFFQLALRQEFRKYDTLLRLIASTVQNFRMLVEQKSTLTQRQVHFRQQFLNNAVPDLWRCASFRSSSTLHHWLNDVTKYSKFFEDWKQHGIPQSILLGGFYFPHCIIDAVRQVYANEMNIPCHSICITTQILPKENSTERSKCSIVVDNLFLSGAAWNTSKYCIEDAQVPATNCNFPPIQLIPTVRTEHISAKNDRNLYQCPIYQTNSYLSFGEQNHKLPNMLGVVDLPTTVKSSYWTQKEVFIVCSD